jgi:hypothetical protein
VPETRSQRDDGATSHFIPLTDSFSNRTVSALMRAAIMAHFLHSAPSLRCGDIYTQLQAPFILESAAQASKNALSNDKRQA